MPVNDLVKTFLLGFLKVCNFVIPIKFEFPLTTVNTFVDRRASVLTGRVVGQQKC